MPTEADFFLKASHSPTPKAILYYAMRFVATEFVGFDYSRLFQSFNLYASAACNNAQFDLNFVKSKSQKIKR